MAGSSRDTRVVASDRLSLNLILQKVFGSKAEQVPNVDVEDENFAAAVQAALDKAQV